MKKIILLILMLVLLVGVIVGARFYWNNLRGIGPALKPPSEDIRDLMEKGEPLSVADNFDITILVKNIPDARVMKFDYLGNLWVSQTKSGKITRIEISNGRVKSQKVWLENLASPHGMAFDPENPEIMYYAEENRISTIHIDDVQPLSKQIIDLPKGKQNKTRTIEFGPDGYLYISIGADCNVCTEDDLRLAKMYRMEKSGKELTEFATGLRNSVFFEWHHITNEIWATEMGRDLLGEKIPPDELNIIRFGKNYGWPYCYGQNTRDFSFEPDKPEDICSVESVEASTLDLPAHSAPLGMEFINDEAWPDDYQDDLLVAYHGSWNKTIPTGYEVVRHKFDAAGNYQGVEDFIDGWLVDHDNAIGRPVDLIIKDSLLYISDDKAGVIYRVKYKETH